ncbi:MAG: cyclic lactone autoinducer peptide [Anaerotignum sp.]|nr:cyclic lactone autoinducer peptide [Anaerotignum sp.]
MGKKFLLLSKKLAGIIPALALFLAVNSVEVTCFFCLYQPDVPEELL